MITLYTCYNNSSCRTARAWLEAHDLPFIVKNGHSCPLTHGELKQMLNLSENGTEDILAKRSKAYVENKEKIETMTLEELLQLINQFPKLLRHPIIMDEKRLQIGFNNDEIRCFIPREQRKKQLTYILFTSGL